MSYLFKEETVNGTANEEETEKIITSTEEAPKTIDSLLFTEITGTLQGDAELVIYHEREQVARFHYYHLLGDKTSNTRYGRPKIDLDLEVPAGDSVSVGMISGGTASDFAILAKYEITG